MGTPLPPRSFGIIELGGNSRQIFEFKGLTGKVFQNQRLRLSKSAGNGFGAASRAVLGNGTPLPCPNQSSIVASGGWEVCDAAHRCFVMKEGRSQIAGVEHPEVSTLTTPPKRSLDGSVPS